MQSSKNATILIHRFFSPRDEGKMVLISTDYQQARLAIAIDVMMPTQDHRQLKQELLFLRIEAMNVSLYPYAV